MFTINFCPRDGAGEDLWKPTWVTIATLRWNLSRYFKRKFSLVYLWSRLVRKLEETAPVADVLIHTSRSEDNSAERSEPREEDPAVSVRKGSVLQTNIHRIIALA